MAQPRPPTSMSCVKCSSPCTDEFIPPHFNNADYSRYYQIGDIWAIQEGTHVPVYRILDSGRTGYTGSSYTATAGFVSTPPDPAGAGNSGAKGRYDPRPCIIMERTLKTSPNGCSICLMATFRRTGRLENLPEILQRFCIPVSPHDLIGPNTTHIHTTPEWYTRNAWVIAYKYDTFGRILGRWENRKSKRPKESSYMLDVRTHRQLEVICERRIIQWEAICAQDPNVKQRCYDQYKVNTIISCLLSLIT